MALQKSIELGSGITATYWKIDSIEFQYVTGYALIKLLGYVSESLRFEGKSAISIKFFELDGNTYIDTFQNITTDPRTNAYNYIKLQIGGEFENSIDV